MKQNPYQSFRERRVCSPLLPFLRFQPNGNVAFHGQQSQALTAWLESFDSLACHGCFAGTRLLFHAANWGADAVTHTGQVMHNYYCIHSDGLCGAAGHHSSPQPTTAHHSPPQPTTGQHRQPQLTTAHRRPPQLTPTHHRPLQAINRPPQRTAHHSPPQALTLNPCAGHPPGSPMGCADPQVHHLGCPQMSNLTLNTTACGRQSLSRSGIEPACLCAQRATQSCQHTF